jgi:hypothetical protein
VRRTGNGRRCPPTGEGTRWIQARSFAQHNSILNTACGVETPSGEGTRCLGPSAEFCAAKLHAQHRNAVLSPSPTGGDARPLPAVGRVPYRRIRPYATGAYARMLPAHTPVCYRRIRPYATGAYARMLPAHTPVCYRAYARMLPCIRPYATVHTPVSTVGYARIYGRIRPYLR